MNRWFVFSITLACLLGAATGAMAHKAGVFAYSEGDTIIGEAAFSGGRPAQNAEIVVRDNNSDEALLTTRTDQNGSFSFAIPDAARTGRMDLSIVLQAGEGHRGEWLLKADEYLPAVLGKTAEKPIITPQSTEAAPTSQPPVQASVPLDEASLRRIVGEVVENRLGPVKRMLSEHRNTPASLRDILGGIGYIIGLAGLFAYFKSKQGER